MVKPLQTINEVLLFLKDVDIPKEHRNNSEAYKIWNAARYLIPNSPDRNYMIGTHQEYIIRSWKRKKWFSDLMMQNPGLRDLYALSESEFLKPDSENQRSIVYN